MNPFTGLALSSPLVLALVPAALAALVYAYRQYGQGERRLVGTLLLLKVLERTAAVRRTFKPPPRFFLELLILILLLLGGAGLYSRSDGVRVLVVLDDSLSMGAVPPGENGSLFLRAKNEALGFVDGLSSGSQVGVLRTSNPVDTAPGSIDEALQELESFEVSHTADDLERIITRVGSDARYDRIVVFTDHRAQFAAPETKARVEVTTVAERPSGNIAITEISLAASPSGQRTLRVTTTSYGDRPTRAALTAYALTPLGDHTSVNQIPLELAPHTSTTTDFPYLKGEPIAYHVHLESRVGGDGADNTLKLDDDAWITAGPSGAKVVVVSDLSIEALGLNRLRHLRFEGIRPNDWRSEAVGPRDTVIFHRFAPPTLPPNNTLFIMPPSGELFTVGDSVANAEVTRWNVADPVASYLNMPALTFKALTPLVLPPWGREAIATTAGCAAFTGAIDGRRVIAAGFEIFPYEGARNRILSILTLNSLGWLADSSTGFEPAGASFPPSEGMEEVRYVGGPVVWDESMPRDKSIILAAPGVVVIKEGGASINAKAVNFFDERESNLGAPTPVTIPRLTAAEDDHTTARSFAATTIAWIALALLLLDFFAFGSRSANESVSPGVRR